MVSAVWSCLYLLRLTPLTRRCSFRLCFGNQRECTTRASLSPFKYVRGIHFSTLVYMRAGVMRLHLPVTCRYTVLLVCIDFVRCGLYASRRTTAMYMCYLYVCHIHTLGTYIGCLEIHRGLLQRRNVSEISWIIIKGLGNNFLTHKIIYCMKNFTYNCLTYNTFDYLTYENDL